MLVQRGADLCGRLGPEPRLHGSIDRSGSVDVDGHPAASQLGGQVDGVGLERCLGGCIGVQAHHGRGLIDDPARHVYDPSPTPLKHRGQERQREADRRFDVDGERRRPPRWRGGNGWSCRLDHSCVVHQDVGRAKLLAGRRGCLGDGLWVGEIGREHQRDPAFAPQRRGRLLELIDRAGQQRNTSATLGQLKCNGASNTPAGAGDQCDPAVERWGHREARASTAARISAGSERVV
jgi:hypothetical protein